MRKTILVAMATSLLMMGSPASATIRDVTDPAGDVMKATNHAHSDPTYSPDPRAERDIVFTRVRHTQTQILIYLRLREASVPRQYADYAYWIVGNNGQSLEAGVGTRRGDPDGYSYANRDWTQRTCPNAYTVNYETNSVSFRFWRGCLRNPKYVRVNATVWESRYPPTGGELRLLRRRGPCRRHYRRDR